MNRGGDRDFAALISFAIKNPFIVGHAVPFPLFPHLALGADADRIARRNYLLAADCASIFSITIAVEPPRL